MKSIRSFKAFEEFGVGRPSSWPSGEVESDSEEFNYIKDFFLEMVDEGFRIRVYRYSNDDTDKQSLPYRYEVTFYKQHEGRKDKVWYNQYVIEYGKMFQEASLTMESQINGKIKELNVYGDRGSDLSYQLGIVSGSVAIG